MGSYFASLRTNTSFSVNYETKELEPTIELIILTYKPEYQVKGREVIKKTALDETRIELPGRDIHKLIAELQIAANGLSYYTQAGDAINSIMKQITVKPEESKSE